MPGVLLWLLLRRVSVSEVTQAFVWVVHATLWFLVIIMVLWLLEPSPARLG